MVIAEELHVADDPEASVLLMELYQRLTRERFHEWRIAEVITDLQALASDAILRSLLVRVQNRITEELAQGMDEPAS
tara:strand:- start:229 stop:459 length:231 start_codon:yes stop_codon:yes gene_type:complete